MIKLSHRINDTNAASWVIDEIKKLEDERERLLTVLTLVLENTAPSYEQVQVINEALEGIRR